MSTSVTMDVPAFVKVASNPARVIGLNSVGLSRNGINDDVVSLLKKAYKLIYRKSLKLDEALIKLEELQQKHSNEHLSILIESIKISSRGITR
jgi:UDP-N-acetylglucosamine acyltransferase